MRRRETHLLTPSNRRDAAARLAGVAAQADAVVVDAVDAAVRW
jgi:hypothetical protein